MPLPVTFALQTIATVCMLLAGKVEETPVTSEDVIIASYERIHKKDLAGAQRKVFSSFHTTDPTTLLVHFFVV